MDSRAASDVTVAESVSPNVSPNTSPIVSPSTSPSASPIVTEPASKSGSRRVGQIVVTLNGPGEVSGWLYPLVTALKQRAPRVRVIAALLPCVYASGDERLVLKRMEGVDAVLHKRQTLAMIFRGRMPKAIDPEADGILLHLGGEPFLSRLLARKLGYPTRAYLERAGGAQRWFDKCYFVEPTSGASGSVIGNMMIDAARLRYPRHVVADGEPPVVAILPGSRRFQVQHALPFLLRTARQAAQARPDLRWQVARADFVSEDLLRECAAMSGECDLGGDPARWEPNGGKPRLITESGLEVEVVSSREAMSQATVALTMPGTNTAELGVQGVPMIVLLPTHEMRHCPAPGVLGYLDRIPHIGPPLKTWLANQYLHRIFLKRNRYLAHPNRKLDRMVVPEMIGKFRSEEVASRLIELLESPLQEIQRDLRRAMGEPGASGRLADALLDALPLEHGSV